MKFTLNRDRVHASVLGLSVEFKKGVPTHVPPELYAEVQAIGAVPEDEIVEEAAAAAINNGTAYSAVVVGTNVVVFHDTPGISVACSETMAGSGNAWAAAALYGHTKATESPAIPVQQSRAVVAAEVTAGLFAMVFNGAVQSAAVQVRTAAGAVKAFDGVTRINGRVVSIDLSGSTDLAATDVVTITAKLAVVA